MDLTLFLGRFHPLLVHLPIGFLILAFIMEVASKKEKFKSLEAAIPFTLLLGAISASGAALLGYLLSYSGGYDENTLWWHQYLGIGVSVFSFICYFIKKQASKDKALISQAILMAVLTCAGHLGGNLTHGEAYLTEYMPFKSKTTDPLARPKVTDLAKVQLFGDIVHPIIKTKCASCHNKSKQKGKLSFSTIESYQKGGKSGPTIIPNDAQKSELLVRVNLPEDHEDFMPTDGKTPLTAAEKALITYWISEANADFDTLFLATQPNEKMIERASHYLQLDGKNTTANLQLSPVEAATINSLQELGFMIRELVAGTHIFEVVLPSSKSDAATIAEKLQKLAVIKDNIIRLSLEETGLQNHDLEYLAAFKNLQNLKLSKNKIRDDNLAVLTTLNQLESINLYQTNISTKGAEQLAQLPKLQRVYIWQTQIDETQIVQLQENFPQIDWIGGI